MTPPLDPQTHAQLSERFPELFPAGAELDPDGPLVPANTHLELARFLKESCGYTLYVTVVGSHWPDREETPLEVATVLRRPSAGAPVARWRVQLGPNEAIDTLYPLFAGADWQEREQFDLVGVRFAGHPDLRRLMMPEDWEGHPLRKEYAIDTPHAPWR